MSGAEVVGIVLGIVGLYPLGEKLCKRVVKHFNSGSRNNDGRESKALEASLKYGGPSIKEAYDRDFRRLGPTFARGDVIAQNGLLQERIRLDDRLISHLLDHLDGSKSRPPPDYRTMHDVSRSVRRGTISVLTDLYQRQSQAAAPPRMAAPPAAPTPSSSSPSSSSSDRANCGGRIQIKKSSLPIISEDKWECGGGCGWSIQMLQALYYQTLYYDDFFQTGLVPTRMDPRGRRKGQDGYLTRDKRQMRWLDFARVFRHHCQGGSKWRCGICPDKPVFKRYKRMGFHIKACHDLADVI